jgi:hypothetical protein
MFIYYVSVSREAMIDAAASPRARKNCGVSILGSHRWISASLERKMLIVTSVNKQDHTL